MALTGLTTHCLPMQSLVQQVEGVQSRILDAEDGRKHDFMTLKNDNENIRAHLTGNTNIPFISSLLLLVSPQSYRLRASNLFLPLTDWPMHWRAFDMSCSK